MKIEFSSSKDSRVNGILSSESTDLIEPDDVLRVYASVITGIDKRLVRKRWLVKPANQPPIETDWIAVGVISVTNEGTPYQYGEKPKKEDDPDVITRITFQSLKVVASFYGGHAYENADQFRDGILLPTNNDQLKTYGLTVQSVGDEIIHIPELLNAQWLDRYDVVFTVGRSVSRVYGVRTIETAGADFFSDERGSIE